MSRLFVMMIFFFLGLAASAQVVVELDSLRTRTLKEVVINEDRLKASEIGLNETKIDAFLLQQAKGSSLAELMRIAGAGQIRSYGSNGLSTPSFRGTSGSHTNILWNGINLQSPLSGQQDLSLVPVGFIEEVSLQKGGSASLYGSGAIGGTIQLNNTTNLSKGLDIATTQRLGSFGNHYQDYHVGWSNKNFGTSTKFFNRSLANDFVYTNRYVRPETTETRDHASISQWGILQQNDWVINNQQLVGFKLWYQNNEVEIPNSILASNNAEAIQKDEFLRSIFSWNLDRQNFSLGYKAAFVSHSLNFTDPTTGISSESTFRSWTNRLDGEWDLNSQATLVAGINYLLDQSEVDAFGSSNPDRSTTALFGSLRQRWFDDRLMTVISAREELVDGETTPVTASFGSEYTLSNEWKIGANVSRNYRIPTFNDLYWNGAGGRGNPDLLPETSFNQELTLAFQQNNGVWQARATAYSSTVDNWILWQPITSAVWTPDNIKQVWSRGVETVFSGSIPLNSISLQWNVSYNFTRTTNQQVSPSGNSRELDKQLFYTPLHESNNFIRLSHQSLDLGITHTWVGKQYTDDENLEVFALPSYQVVSTYLNKSLYLGSFTSSLRFEVNNILDKSYENRRGYPLYGRNYSITLNVQFNNSKKDD